MENNSIRITPEELRNIAMEMELKISDATEALNDASVSMNKTPDALQGQTSNKIVEEYETLRTKYNSFCEKMVEFTDKLKKTADEYEKLDQELASSAEQLTID